MPDHLERLYDAHAAALFAFLLNLTRNEETTRDLLQELFIKVANRPRLLEGVYDERAFLLRMAHHLAIDTFRRAESRQRHREQLVDQAPALFAPAADPDTIEFRRQLATALGELPPEQRAVVHLKLWEGLTFDAIAGTLEIPLNTAASRYRYGIDKLRTRLRPLYDEINHGRV